MSSTKPAWIGAGALVIGAIITGLFSLHHSTPKKINFSGEVRDSEGKPLKGARVISAEDQLTPESTYSDDNGIFHITLSDAVGTLKITVVLAGYDSISRDVNPHRTGSEEFVLQPTLLPHNELKNDVPRQKFTTKGNNSPIIVGHHNSVITPPL
jgi:Carboxypeptidase regulatory-like domain